MKPGTSAKRRKGSNSRKRAKKAAERMAALRSALCDWRTSASSAFSCSEPLLCTDEMLDQLVQARPTTIEELNSLDFGNFKALFFGPTLFELVNRHWPPKPRQSSEELWKKIWADDLDISSIFQHTAAEASTPPAPSEQKAEKQKQTEITGQGEDVNVDIDIDIGGVSIPVEMACSSGDDGVEVREMQLAVVEGKRKKIAECSEVNIDPPAVKAPRVNLDKGQESSLPPASDASLPASSQKSPKVVWSTTYEVLTRFRSGEQQVVHSNEEVIIERVTEDFKARGGTSDGAAAKTRKRKSLEPELPFLPSRDPAPDLDCIKRQNDYYKEMAERLRAQERVKRMVDSWFEACLKNARTSSEKAKNEKGGSEKNSSAGDASKMPYWIGTTDSAEQPKTRQGLPHKKKPEISKLQLRGLLIFAREAGAQPQEYKDMTTEELRPLCSELVDQWEVNRILACKSLPDWSRCLVVLRLQGPQTLETAKAAFKKLTLIVHPDKNKSKGASEAFCMVKEALEWLCARM
ncbi:hypothetical protein BSKO_10323 [Bryopsis sp. KO-2023]|nr:hypothetical protein BSKO_10323 [Bryopsis sp. KO-2023]